MKKTWLFILLTSILTTSFAERPSKLSANYIGYKMWNTQKIVPYNGNVSIEIADTIVYLRHAYVQKVDTFFYKGIRNNRYCYDRRKNNYCIESISLSKDSLYLQIGELQEQNYFYKLHSINVSRTCPDCRGIGMVLCPNCHGFGHVAPRKNGNPDEVVGICTYCHGSKSMTQSPCIRCNGVGNIVLKEYHK